MFVDNYQVIKLLLEHGADLCLPGLGIRPYMLQFPLELARTLVLHEWKGYDELVESGNDKEVYRVVKEAADKLDVSEDPDAFCCCSAHNARLCCGKEAQGICGLHTRLP